jgi:2'-5' RNA ligase
MNEADRITAERHAAIWEEFRRQPSVTAWAGRAPLGPEVTATLGFVIPVDDQAVRERLSEVVARLEATGAVVPFPPDYWHITIVPPALLTSGEPSPPELMAESFAEEALAKAKEAVRDAAPFEVTVRGLNAFRDVAVAVPYDGGRGMELGAIIRAAVPELPQRYPGGLEPLPHISLTQYAREDSLEALAALIEEGQDTGFGSFRAERVEMFVVPWSDGVPGAVSKHALPLEGR